MATMKQCLLEQANTMHSVAQQITAELNRVLACVGTGFDHIYMVGSGTSLNAALTARCAFERYTGAEVRVVPPFDFVNYFPRSRITKSTLVLGISQTARSTGTIQAVQLAGKQGARTVFVTAEPENPGAQSAETVLNTFTGPELVGAKTKGFTSTMAALFSLAAALGGKPLPLTPVAETLDVVLSATGRHIGSWVDSILTAKSVQLVSYGPCMGIAREGALKILETLRIPVEVYDVEEYMHGPYHTLTPASHMVFLCPPGAGQARAGRLLAFVQGITAHTYLLADEAFAAGFVGKKLPIPTLGDELLDCICYIPPLQWLANDATLQLGRKPEASAYPDFHKALSSKHMPPVNYYTGGDE